ncbi:MAG TPA: hypothetical protein VF530_12300 [Planctomycetota bacterium]
MTAPRSRRLRSLLALLAALLCAPPLAAQVVRRGPQGLSAFRPQHGSGYFPFARTKVPEAWEEHPELGPGIRVHGALESDPAGEDDLIEILVARPFEGTELVLARSGPALALWSTRTKAPGSAVPFSGDVTAPLAFGAARTLTLWVEWSGAAPPGLAALELRAPEWDAALDRLLFHAFTSLVVALGGEGQVPGLPLDPNHGTFVVATDLYERGYDVLMRDEDEVSPTGTGPVYTEVVNAIQNRAVGTLAIYGYSHGGGSTYHLCERLNTLAGSIGAFTVAFTSYADGIENDSDVDQDRELRRPLASAYHANHYQVGTFADFFLDGGPVSSSFPSPSGLNVETVSWGVGATHFLVDDYAQVFDFIGVNLEARVVR